LIDGRAHGVNNVSRLFVSDANLLFGDHDLIVKLEADNMGSIARLVVESIRSVPGVLNTKTLACAEIE
jgi:DNA-binding Lrp family transcriptional regulator